MKDIAARMDVSVNTVHKALTGKPGVSDEVRARIASLAERWGTVATPMHPAFVARTPRL